MIRTIRKKRKELEKQNKRTIRKKRKELEKQNKKLSASDDNALKKAEKIINGEFGFALSILPEEVPDFIAKNLCENG